MNHCLEVGRIEFSSTPKRVDRSREDLIMSKKLLLIESSGKIKKLSKILGTDWTIKATSGHIRELANDGADSLGFDLNGDRVSCRFISRNKKASSIISELKHTVKHYDRIYLATDPDLEEIRYAVREGETIAWHACQVLNLKNPKRVVYSEITNNAVRSAIAIWQKFLPNRKNYQYLISLNVLLLVVMSSCFSASTANSGKCQEANLIIQHRKS